MTWTETTEKIKNMTGNILSKGHLLRELKNFWKNSNDETRRKGKKKCRTENLMAKLFTEKRPGLKMSAD